MKKLSVLLPTYNEEAVLTDCLESVKWADEILVVDSYSTDKTLEIARNYGARIIQHEYINSAKQKNWAIPQCSHDWVLQIDADERVDAELECEIRKVLADSSCPFDGYRINFKHHMLEKWMKHTGLYPEFHLRLFRRHVGRFQDREVDAHVLVPGSVGVLHGHMLHYGVESVSQRLRALDRYTRYEADERERQGRAFSWFNIVARPLAAFAHTYFYKLGFRDGVRGFLLAVLKADFVFWTYAKLWEKEVRAGKRQ